MDGGCNIAEDIICNNRIIKYNNISNPVRNFIGIQCQFYRYAKICCDLYGDCFKDSCADYFKAWSIRGTLHLHHMKDYNVVIYKDMVTKYMNDFWNDETKMTVLEKEYFSKVILEELNKENLSKKKLIDLCMKKGLTDEKKKILFNPWGGLPRYLIETGKIILLADDENTFSLSPKVELVDKEIAEKELMRRYLEGYAPCTEEDAMYFFKWAKKKTRILMENVLEESLKGKYRIEIINEDKYIFMNNTNCYNPLEKICILSAFDPMLLGYEKKKNPILPVDLLRNVYTLQGIVKPTIVYKGKIAGIWNIKNKKTYVTLFRTLPPNSISEIVEKLHDVEAVSEIIVKNLDV